MPRATRVRSGENESWSSSASNTCTVCGAIKGVSSGRNSACAWRQSIAIRRADPRLGLPLGSVLRASWEIGDYRIGVQHPDSTFRGASIAGLARPGIDALDRPMAATLETRPLTDADLDAVQSAARELLVGGRLSGLPDLRLLGARGLSSFLSVDRVQGVRVGARVAA